MKSAELYRFSLKARGRSFRYAFSGVYQFFLREHNSWIHLSATFLSLAMAWWYDIRKIEALILVILIVLVWMAELFNTAIEKTVDLVSLEFRPEIKFIKDVSAAAVLITAIGAMVGGLLIFYPKIF